MEPSNIKILEFEGEDDPPRAPRRKGGAAGGEMRVLEFDEGRSAPERRVATPDSVGPIKIVEYDEEPSRSSAPEGRRPAPRAEESGQAFRIPNPGEIKVVEFGDEGKPASRDESAPDPARKGGIRIVEFD